MEDKDLLALSHKLEQLIQYIEQITIQNKELIKQEKQWQQERLQLIEQKDLAKSKVEAIIARIKDLEQANE